MDTINAVPCPICNSVFYDWLLCVHLELMLFPSVPFFSLLPASFSDCMKFDETLYEISDKVKEFAVVYLVDITKVPEFNKM